MADISAIGNELHDVICHVAEMQRDCANGRVPLIADAKLLVSYAALLQAMIERAALAQLRSTPAPTAEQDAAAQVAMAAHHNERADRAEAAA